MNLEGRPGESQGVMFGSRFAAGESDRREDRRTVCIFQPHMHLVDDRAGPPADRVTVRVLLFARYAEVTGQDRITLELRPPATVADAVALLRARAPNGDSLPARPLAAVNQVHALLTDVLADGDEVALLPPLAGG